GWAGAGDGSKPQQLSKDDFENIKQLNNEVRDPAAKGEVPLTGTAAKNAAVAGGKLERPLVVGINTWAGHAPGIVANGGLEPGSAASLYKKKYGLDVKFVLLEDPTVKLTAFMKGEIDLMWDTVDSYAREASVLAEKGIQAKSIIQEDWSRGGDGIVSLKTIKSIEDLKGKKIATTKFTPSHWLLLFLLSQSGLSPDDRAGIEKNL